MLYDIMRTGIRAKRKVATQPLNGHAARKPAVRRTGVPSNGEKNIFDIIGEIAAKIPESELQALANDPIVRAHLEDRKTATSKKITAVALRKLPANDRAMVLRASAKAMIHDYKPGGDLLIEGVEDIIEY
jgi:hypothetical protein